MIAHIIPSPLSGTLSAIPSKSDAHRVLICAALADKETEVICKTTGKDIEATKNCLIALGAEIKDTENGFLVIPISVPKINTELDCGESGSTLRFLLPISAALGTHSRFIRHGRLTERPLSPMKEELIRGGAEISDTEPLLTAGKIKAGHYQISGEISSQYISGLLMALSVTEGESTLDVTGNIQSLGYIEMTLQTLDKFGAKIKASKDRSSYQIIGQPHLVSPRKITIEGDWSNSAVWLAAGAIGKSPVSLHGLSLNTCQGDRAIWDILKQFGAKIEQDENGILTVYPSSLHAAQPDIRQVPDLAPILAVIAAFAEGETVLTGAERLKIKESDRILSICTTLQKLGADIQGGSDQITIKGASLLNGGTVSSFNDHRIVMCAALASLRCQKEVIIKDAQAITKSYPSFFDDFQKIGGKVSFEEETP